MRFLGTFALFTSCVGAVIVYLRMRHLGVENTVIVATALHLLLPILAFLGLLFVLNLATLRLLFRAEREGAATGPEEGEAPPEAEAGRN